MQTAMPAASRIKNQELAQERKKLIVEVARTLFRQRGYHGTSVREIGEAAGLSQGTLYNYIRSKDEVLFLVCDELLSALRDAAEDAASQISPCAPPELVESIVDRLLDIVAARQDDVILVYQEVHALAPETRRAVMQRGADFVVSVARLLDSVRNPNPAASVSKEAMMAANIVSFLPFILALRRWVVSRSLSLDEQVAGVRAFLIKGMAGWGEEEPEASTSKANAANKGAENAG